MRTTHKTALATVTALGLILAANAGIRLAKSVPTVSITSPASGSSFSAGSTITIAASAYDRDGIARVDFYANGVRIGYDTTAPFALNWTRASAGSHSLTAVAVDKRKTSGKSAAVGISVLAATADTTAPTVPTGLTLAARTSSSVTLAWTASTDTGGSGIRRYDIYRNEILVGSTTTTSYTDSGLLPSTTYSYTVQAVDNAVNMSTHTPPLLVETDPATTTPRRVAGYFTQWGIYSPGYLVKTLDTSGTAARLTHLTYAFGNVRNNRCEVGVLKATNPDTGEGGDAYADYSRSFTAAESVDGVADVWGAPLRGNWNQLKKLKKKHPNMKVLISLGGWTWSRGFASAARPENREAFVASCIDAYIRGNLPAFDYAGGAGAAAGVFDGFDIDWEYPAACGLTCGSSEDSANFTALLAEFRRQLDAVRPGLELTVAVGAGIDKIRVTRPDLYHPYVDAINVMSYDFHGGWESRTNFHSALFNSPNDPSTGDVSYYNTNDAIQAFLSRGVPASKLQLGMASYGRGWTNVGSTNQGLYQAGTPAQGTVEAGVERYAVLATLSWPKYLDTSSKARWIYDGSTFWSFDDPATVTDKMAYVKVQGLGGAFLWDFSGDDSQAALATAMSNGLK